MVVLICLVLARHVQLSILLSFALIFYDGEKKREKRNRITKKQTPLMPVLVVLYVMYYHCTGIEGKLVVYMYISFVLMYPIPIPRLFQGVEAVLRTSIC
mgnify:CR=1 FL=1